MRRASSTRPPLPDYFEIVVIGGGINGVAIARQCALSGRRVLLLERNDFASGTTSRSTRIIHGGLRYLEHAEIALVRESLRERERLLRLHPNLVRPMDFVIALEDGSRRSALEIRAGLWLYRKLAGVRPPARAGVELQQLERLLDSGQRWSLFHYEDAQCEFPERLVAEWLIDAIDAGAIVRNHTEALELEVEDGCVRAVLCRDLLTKEECEVEAARVINATGPWADHLCASAGLDTGGPMVGGVRGTHIVLPLFPGAPKNAVYMQAKDGRPIFVIPWNRQLLVGTTEIPDHGDPARVQPTREEIDYLLASLNRSFPAARVSEPDIVYAFSGIRPLPYVESEEPSAISRRHLLHDHAADGASGLISVIGGKLTTAASLARDCARVLGLKVSVPVVPYAAVGDASGIESTFTQWAHMIAGAAKIDVSSARAIASWQGRHALCVAHLAQTCPTLAEPIAEGTDHIIAEAVNAVRFECAVTLADILLRRVPVALSANWDESATRQAGERIGKALGWPTAQIELQIQDFEAEKNAFLHKPLRAEGSGEHRDRQLPMSSRNETPKHIA